MKFTPVHVFLIGLVALILGGAGTAGFIYRVGGSREGLTVRVGGAEGFSSRACSTCGSTSSCVCNTKNKNSCAPVAPCPRVQEPDLSKYILKSQVPSSRSIPDMSNYMLKTECPPVPDLSKYVLKSSIPKAQPVIIDNSKCGKDAGECPPCPRAKCAPVICPKPVACPIPAPCPRMSCPKTVVKCKSEEESNSIVRPFLAPLNMTGFGSA